MGFIRKGIDFAASIRKKLQLASVPFPVRRLTEQRFIERKRKLLNDIESHWISQELMNPSIEKPALFGFLGFDAGQKPVQHLINYLDELIQGKYDGNVFRVVVPNTESLRNATHKFLRWTGYTWIELLEGKEDVFNYRFYLRDPTKPRSNSLLGIQVNKPVRSEEYKPSKDYVTKMLKKFQDDIDKTIAGKY